MSDSYLYLDTSAFVKLCWPETESTALRLYLRRRPLWVSSALLRAEALRAALRQSMSRVASVRAKLRDIALIDIDRGLMEQAGTMTPPGLRTLDAIHLAAALSLGSDLDRIVTYDQRMIGAAGQQGLPVVSPGLGK